MFHAVDKVINESLDLGFPGGQLLISVAGEIQYQRAFGSVWLESIQVVQDKSAQGFYLEAIRGNDVTHETLFDIASLTKIFATTYLFQKYVEQDPFLLSRTLADFFGEDLRGSVVGNISVKALLSHHSGFEPNPLFYDPNYSAALYCQNRAIFSKALLAAPLVNPPETIGLYSDVDFMLLSFILEKIAGTSLDHQLEALFWNPLSLTHIGYQPLLKGISPQNIAATERFGNTRDGLYLYPNIRKNMLQGEVQDEKAFYCMEGISGHAGLFSNAQDLHTLFQLITPHMRYSKKSHSNHYFNEAVIAQFLQPHYSDSTFGLGYRLNGPDMRYMFGEYAGQHAFGHTGWTGCLATHDPEYDLTIIYLTNRKNTPVCNPERNPHLFYGDQLPAGKYLNIIHAIYQDLGIPN